MVESFWGIMQVRQGHWRGDDSAKLLVIGSPIMHIETSKPLQADLQGLSGHDYDGHHSFLMEAMIWLASAIEVRSLGCSDQNGVIGSTCSDVCEESYIPCPATG